MIDAYDRAGGQEAMLRFGPADGPVVVAAMPLLEEWNRTRAFVVALLRALAERGIAGALPDLPGHGESLSPLPALDDLRGAMAAATAHLGRDTIALGIRSGALLDTHVPHRARWHLAPVAGDDLLRELDRVSRVGNGPAIRSGHARTVAGTDLPAVFLDSLAHAVPEASARTVRLAGDPRPADRHVPGPPLWRRSEPGSDPALVALLAEDIASWLATCAG